MKVLFVMIVLLASRSARSQTLAVHFGFNEYTLDANAKLLIDSFFSVEQQTISMGKIKLSGHCDFIGSEGYNDSLSFRRVMTVKKYLEAGYINPAKIVAATANGKKDPLNENKTAAERQLNRRVEISIVQAGQGTLSSSKENFSLTEKIADTATKAGTSIVLKNMNFYGGTPFLLPESFSTMDELFEVMRVNHNLVIEIQGHICCIASPGDSPYGPTGNGLSEERAKMIYAELTAKGIDPDRVSYKGFGHSMPIYPYPEKTEEERSANRRVEIKIIRK
jgi:outer membrane protein OmpA-like peptidoglycan-associated protein